MKRSYRWFLVVWFFCSQVSHAELLFPTPASSPSSSAACAADTEYYDETILGCKRCSSGSDGGTSSSLVWLAILRCFVRFIVRQVYAHESRCDARSLTYRLATRLGSQHPVHASTSLEQFCVLHLSCLTVSLFCRGNAILVAQDDSSCASTWPAPCNFYDCTSCPQGQAPSKDASRCMMCGNSTLGVDDTASECKCASNSILLEKNEVRSHMFWSGGA